MAFLPREQLEAMGFRHLGKDVLLSDKAAVYNPGNISIGDNARIDDFCILSAGAGGISIGRYIHIGCYSALLGSAPIILHDLAAVSGRVTIYSNIDDTSGEYLVQCTFPMEYRHVIAGEVIIEKQGLVGAGSIIFPKVTIGRGTLVAAMSLVRESCDPFSIYGGVPARKIKSRGQGYLELEKKFLKEIGR
jgi:galactoside O-acetyltransferase